MLQLTKIFYFRLSASQFVYHWSVLPICF